MNNAEGVGKLSDVCCHLTDSYLRPQWQHQEPNIIQVGQGSVAEAAADLRNRQSFCPLAILWPPSPAASFA